MLKDKITRANKEIRKLYDTIDMHSELFEPLNLKLYDASFYIYEKGLKHEDFSSFCDYSFSEFIHTMKECYDIDFLKVIHPLARTSSFYLSKRVLKLEDKDIDTVVEIMYHYFGYPDVVDSIMTNDFKWIDAEFVSGLTPDEKLQLEEELDFINESLVDSFKEMIEDEKIMYDYIKHFKEHQITYLKKYLSRWGLNED